MFHNMSIFYLLIAEKQPEKSLGFISSEFIRTSKISLHCVELEYFLLA